MSHKRTLNHTFRAARHKPQATGNGVRPDTLYEILKENQVVGLPFDGSIPNCHGFESW